MSRILTRQQLVDAHACKDQVDLFEKTFGDAVDVTVELAVSVVDMFDWDFAANNFLSKVALDRYNDATEPLWRDYKEATNEAPYDNFKVRQAWRNFTMATAPLWAELYISEQKK